MTSALLYAALFAPVTRAQAPPDNPASASVQIELLETRIRFETDGGSRKEIHTRVHIQNELGVQEFGRITFGYNRAFEQIEIPFVRITHANGGIAEILPSAITDQPNLAVVNAAAYQDVRVKSVRILGLQPGDTLEYRVITTVSHHPLAPDFWLDHSFDRTGVVSSELFELDLPASPKSQVRISPATPATSTETSGVAESARTIYRWQRASSRDQREAPQNSPRQAGDQEPDLVLSTSGDWQYFAVRLAEKLMPGSVPLESIHDYQESLEEMGRGPKVAPEISRRAAQLAKTARTDRQKLEAVYDFVSRKIATVDISLGSSGFAVRPAAEILSSGYATAEDKFVLFAALASALKVHARPALTGYCDPKGLSRPSVFTHLLISAGDGKKNFWLDPSLEVAPFGVIPPTPKKCVFVLERGFFFLNSIGHEWQTISPNPPFAAVQHVKVDATLAVPGNLSAKVHYSIRGDNELLLRVAFHQAPREKWKDLAQLLSITDGFRGTVTSVTASDPFETHQPFTLEYEISQPNFVDWKKQPVRIPALLPQLGLPDLPAAKPAVGAGEARIELGTPLEVETSVTLHLPPGTSARAPAGTSVERDYAAYTSKYAAQALTLSASRHLKFILRELPASRAGDYNAFVRAVQNDEAQEFTLERAPAAPAAKPKPAVTKSASDKPQS